MPHKASGPKKARWTAAQKSEARKAPRKPHHRGQPDGPKSSPKRAARSDSRDGEYTTRPRSQRSPRWDREDPRRQSGPSGASGPVREPSRGSRDGAPRPDRSAGPRGDDRGGRARIRSQRRPRACAPTTPAPTSWSGPSRLFSRTVGAPLPARTPRTLSLFFGFDSSPHQLTRAPAMSRGGGCCAKNDLSLSPSESKSLRRSRLPR